MKECKIVEDLLPLFEENLVQDETKKWIEAHIASCEKCNRLTNIELEVFPSIPKHKSADAMMRSAQLKLTIYQLLFVLLSFIFAINTSMLNESFAFILSYFILGAVAYYFYRSVWLTILLAFIPIFIWTIYETIYSYHSVSAWYIEQMQYFNSTIEMLFNTLLGGIFTGILHTVFAVLGLIVVALLLKAFRKEQHL